MIHRTLLSLPAFPDAVPEPVLESACLVSQLLRAQMTADLRQLDSDQGTWPLVMGSYPVDFRQMMSELVARSEAIAAASALQLTRLCAEYGIPLDLRRGVTTYLPSAQGLVDLARLHDLTILPVPEVDAAGGDSVRQALFGSGKPVLLLPSRQKPLRSLDRIVVAWDWSREAARALSDALPILALARQVTIVTVSGEKHIASTATNSDLDKFLAAHAIKYSLQRVDLNGHSIGVALMDHAQKAGADLLVMGAYGHGRLQEFILGGATRDILRDPRLPVLMAH